MVLSFFPQTTLSGTTIKALTINHPHINFSSASYVNSTLNLEEPTQLKVSDLIITDQFDSPLVKIYRIDSIISPTKFSIKESNQKFIYDSLMINFPSHTILSSVQIPPSMNRIIQIHHPSHNLAASTLITIDGSKSISYIPSNIINSSHQIHQILSPDSYQIILPPFVPTELIDSLLPNIITIKFPDYFQLNWTPPHTLGSILNFNSSGTPIAITPFKHSISNTDPYENQLIQLPLKKINMTGYTYFNILSKELGHIGQIKLTDNPGTIVFDSFAKISQQYDPPITNVSSLHFSMVQPDDKLDDKLVEFNYINHSFILEIIE